MAKEARRRAAKFTAVPPELSITEEDWKMILEIWDHRCAYCQKPHRKLTQDHVIPLSRGGSHTVNNVVPACRSCNSRKFTKDVDEFLQQMKNLGL